MFAKFVEGYRSWEDENIAILQNPAVANTLPPGIRRYTGLQTARMSAIERRQMLDFALKYRGIRLYVALAKLMVVYAVAGVVLHLVQPRVGLLASILLCELIGVSITVSSFAAWFNYRLLAGRRLLLLLAVVFCCASAGYVVGASAAAHKKGLSATQVLKDRWLKVLISGGAIGAAFLTPLGVVAVVRNRQYHKIVSALELDAERERSARQLSEQRLRLLHAQIEPHFLFNTLGAVQQLAERGAPDAATLTGHLIDFLRASMNQMRDETVTVAADFDLIGAYLHVMQARLGERLRYRLVLPPALAQHEVPGMLLLTLVENAIKHGIEPSLRGGEIHVSASQRDDRLHLTVADSGVGLPYKRGDGGEGLNNVRSRLQLKYGSQASFSLMDGPDGGAVAEIIVPLTEEKSA